jgi:hypothetical protein
MLGRHGNQAMKSMYLEVVKTGNLVTLFGRCQKCRDGVVGFPGLAR